MTDLEIFIQNNQELIDLNTKESWIEIYDLFESSYYDDYLAGELSRLLIDINADPCHIIGFVPRRFLMGQSDLTKYEIPKNASYIGMSAFEDTALEEIRIPESVRELDFLCFSGTKVKKVFIPDTVHRIANGAFHSCLSLEEVMIGKVSELGEDVFANCENLTKLIICDSISQLDSSIVKGCKSLKEIDFLGTIETFEKIRVGYTESSIKIKCIDGEISW